MDNENAAKLAVLIDADNAPGAVVVAAVLRHQTIGEAMDLPDEAAYRLWSAVHEVGHATALLGTGHGDVTRCQVMLYPGAAHNAFTDASWTDLRGRLALLHGGMLAAERWLRECGWWDPRRERASRAANVHDRRAIDELEPWDLVLRATREWTAAILDERWPQVLHTAQELATRGQLTGSQLREQLGFPAARPDRE